MVQLAWVLRNFLSWIPCGLLDYFCWINLRGLIFWGSGVGGRPLHFVGLIFEWWLEHAVLELIWLYVTCNWRAKERIFFQIQTALAPMSTTCRRISTYFFVFVAPLILTDCEWLGIQPKYFNGFQDCWFCACLRVPTNIHMLWIKLSFLMSRVCGLISN